MPVKKLNDLFYFILFSTRKTEIGIQGMHARSPQKKFNTIYMPLKKNIPLIKIQYFKCKVKCFNYTIFNENKYILRKIFSQWIDLSRKNRS